MNHFFKLIFIFIMFCTLSYETNSFAEETHNSAQQVSTELNDLINEQLHPGSLQKKRDEEKKKIDEAKLREQENSQLDESNSDDTSNEQSTPPVGVILKQDVYVNGDFITLGDIFDNVDEKANVIIDHSPKVGSKKILSNKTLKRIAEVNHLEWNPYMENSSIVIQRKSMVISNDYIKSMLKTALQREDGFKNNNSHKIKIDRNSFNWVIPADHYDSLAISNLSYDSDTGYFQASFTTKNMSDKRVIHGYVIEMIDIPILINSKSKGDIIKDDDIEYITVEKRKVVRNTILEPEQLVGKQAKRNIDINKVIKIYDVGRAITIRKKSLITIVYKTKMINLEAQGKALESGGMGDVIKVENLNSKVTVSATIIDVGKVQVGVIK